MSDELSRLLGRVAERHGAQAQASADPAALVSSIVSRARGRRRATAAISVAASVGLAAAVGGVAYLGAGGAWSPAQEPGVAIALSQAPEPTPEEPTLPSPDASAAPLRGDGFPEASPLDAAAWAAVGEGWTVRIVGVAAAAEGAQAPEAVLYLVSPDERWYEVTALGDEAALDARVATWREREQTLTVTWRDAQGLPHASEVSLPGGEASEIAFAMPGGATSSAVTPVAVDDAGTELWRAVAPDGAARYYRWSADRGWTVAALSTEVLIAGDGAFAAPSGATRGEQVRPDGAALALDRSSRADGVIDEVAFYDLDADVVWVQPSGMTAAGCTFTGWGRLGSQVTYACAGEEPAVDMPKAPPLGGLASLAINQHPDASVAVRSLVAWGGRLSPEALAGS